MAFFTLSAFMLSKTWVKLLFLLTNVIKKDDFFAIFYFCDTYYLICVKGCWLASELFLTLQKFFSEESIE